MFQITYPALLDNNNFPDYSLDTQPVDLSDNVLQWKPTIEPAWTYTKTIAKTLKKSYDFGLYKDKFYCDIDFVLDYNKVDSFVDKWWKALEIHTGSRSCYLRSDLDLFIPGIRNDDPENEYSFPTEVVPVSLTYGGKFNQLSSKQYIYTLRLMLVSPISHQSQLTTPNFFQRAYWESSQQYNQNINIMRGQQKYDFVAFSQNFDEEWMVEFPWLNRSQANELVRWILTKRTNDYSLSMNPINNFGREQRTSTFKLKDFSFERSEGFYWTAELTFVENSRYNYYVQ